MFIIFKKRLSGYCVENKPGKWNTCKRFGRKGFMVLEIKHGKKKFGPTINQFNEVQWINQIQLEECWSLRGLMRTCPFNTNITQVKFLLAELSNLQHSNNSQTHNKKHFKNLTKNNDLNTAVVFVVGRKAAGQAEIYKSYFSD